MKLHALKSVPGGARFPFCSCDKRNLIFENPESVLETKARSE